MTNDMDLYRTAAAILTDLSISTSRGRSQCSSGFLDVLSSVITTAVADLGGLPSVLDAGVPADGAEAIRALLNAQDPAELLRYRTRPLVLVVDAGLYLDEIGYADLYEASGEQIAAEILAGDLTPADAKLLEQEMSVLRTQDESRWLEDFTIAASTFARSRGMTAELKVVTRQPSDTWVEHDALTSLVFDKALTTTRLPGSRMTPAQLPADVAGLEILSGRLPHQRVRAQMAHRTSDNP